ncbi:unnamed protein product [Rotaria magnacalcarata]|uniref:Poly [ADP-ribose] polymerase n=1 Tax=Rotaria magnacalcarata TaxID=392030 RepID=A0A8S2NHH5_9BILA|nr:unnamed protein product [Rotaria magnacalcarata]
MNCADINCELLVKLIRLKKYSERKFGSTESLSKTRNSIVDNKDLSKEADINKQIDVSFPSIFFAKQIDMEIIEMILCQKNIRIEKKFKECENEYFRRSTLQLEEKSDVDELLATPILTHDHVDFKIKRTKQLTDRTCFVLKILVSDQQNKVDENRVKLYISLLVGNSISYRIFNLSISDEKAYLVQCNNDIDFDRIRQQYETRRQLQGRDVTLMQIHEYDTASIYYIDEHKTMKYDDLENILQSVRKYVFTFQLVNEYCAEVEFINSVAFKEWMSVIEKVKDKYRVNVEPIIQEVDDGNYTENSSSSTTENIPFNFDKPNLVSITLRSEWSMVAAHPVFQLEYKDYIQRNDYMIAARPQDLFELRGKLFPKPNQNFQTDRRNPPRNYQPDNRLLPVPLMQQEIVEPPSSSLPAAKPANTSSIFPITKAEEMNMFLMDKFEERLQEHLKEICNVNIIIERHAVNDKVKGDKTRIRIKLTGEMNDVESALNDLSNLFSSLRTREFNDKTDGNWTKIEEVVDLIQHHFALINLHALCQRISPTCLHVYFFDVTNPQFGIDEQKIDDIINNQFSLATIIHNQRLASAKFIKEWTDLEEKIRKQDNYKKDICFSREADSFYLFGLTKLVKELRQTFEQLKNKYIPQACKISLSDKQLNFLRYVAKTNLNKIEKQYKGDGCDISLTRLEQHGHFLAPVDMHSRIKDTLEALKLAVIFYVRFILAFPSVGCGKLGFDPSIIAQHMIDETEAQLISSKSTMNVSFILVQEQQNVYDAFVKYLNTIQTNVAQQSSKSKTSQHLKIPYDEKIIEITLIGSNNAQLDQCKNDILELANACLFKTRLTDKQDMMDWSQNTISTYYDHCLKQHVIPTLNFNTLSIELVGPKDAVREAEKHFYELTTETLKAARIHAVSRGIIWSVEVTPNSDTWEQYSFKLNGLIEDAYLKKLVNYDFVNDKQERCRIVFSNMEEFHGTDVRRIRRKVVDSLLPDTWEPSDQNCKRVVLQSSSKEYRDVSQQFAATMRGQYTQIVKIERIQNERWFKQYAAHRDDFKQRYKTLDERLLFHGCDGTSANKIAQECFNRSFAGVHGVAYGCGVYFHSHANYSHSYAKPDISGQRTMFLARVLIGKTCRGNQGMKTPLPGHDTTTDGQHIFVIYHDAGAYADHLITYQ